MRSYRDLYYSYNIWTRASRASRFEMRDGNSMISCSRSKIGRNSKNEKKKNGLTMLVTPCYKVLQIPFIREKDNPKNPRRKLERSSKSTNASDWIGRPTTFLQIGGVLLERTVSSCHHVIEDVECGFSVREPCHSRLLQQHGLQDENTCVKYRLSWSVVPNDVLIRTWVEAEATWPAWSKSRETMWEKRLAFPFMEVLQFPNASRMV